MNILTGVDSSFPVDADTIFSIFIYLGMFARIHCTIINTIPEHTRIESNTLLKM